MAALLVLPTAKCQALPVSTSQPPVAIAAVHRLESPDPWWRDLFKGCWTHGDEICYRSAGPMVTGPMVTRLVTGVLDLWSPDPWWRDLFKECWTKALAGPMVSRFVKGVLETGIDETKIKVLKVLYIRCICDTKFMYYKLVISIFPWKLMKPNNLCWLCTITLQGTCDVFIYNFLLQ